MSWFSKSQDHLPLTWWRGQPVYFAAFLALGGLASMILTALLQAARVPAASYLVFTFWGLEVGRIWTVLTYVLWNPPSLWMFLTSYFLWRFGEDVEKFFGRRTFARMFLIFVLAEPLLLSLIALTTGYGGWPAAGLFHVEFAVFIAFATLYPRAQISLFICCVQCWIIATALVGISVLECLATHDWSGLFLLSGQVGLAYALVRHEQGQWSLSSLFAWAKKSASRRPEPQLRVVRRSREDPIPSSPDMDVDSILDKIGRHGLESLTPEERRTLEKASRDLGGRGK